MHVCLDSNKLSVWESMILGVEVIPNAIRCSQDTAVEPTTSLALNVLIAERTPSPTLTTVPADTYVTVTFSSSDENGQDPGGQTVVISISLVRGAIIFSASGRMRAKCSTSSMWSWVIYRYLTVCNKT